ncbi:putative dienelactone hydrolase family [Candidatus Nitrososphaera gargensis Ga9.2]|uniref:Putative dienelactone hydrolase family n=1 Tax=Nitrososphaera gargensis (strain Ga9.2) TaxID=1237085 RepID=K0IJN8_NITGG|nr:putative dienelactone hydrolase family [Candidatus Nitrososphaera gargensis Ga9.2]
MIHEWWGLNQNIKDMTEQLANEGYVVLAVDLYNGEVATESSRAGQLAGSVRNNPGEAISNLNAAVEYVSSLPNVNSSRVASLGRCLEYSALKTSQSRSTQSTRSRTGRQRHHKPDLHLRRGRARIRKPIRRQLCARRNS